MKILGVSRAQRYSPNSVERDAAIFKIVCANLLASGAEVAVVDEDELRNAEGYEAIFSMARDNRVQNVLYQQEKMGVFVLNSPSSLRNLRRSSLLSLPGELRDRVAPMQLASQPVCSRQFPLWWKRDVPAVAQDDVRMLHTLAELSPVMQTDAAILMGHVDGVLLKCYGVVGTDFFSVHTSVFHKFGYENSPRVPEPSRTVEPTLSSVEPTLSTVEPTLRVFCDAVARSLGVSVYGADVVCRPEGSFSLIDFNDWPSFAACRDEAAHAISNLILNNSSKQ